MDIWVVGTSNKLFIRGSYTETKLKKKKVITGKTPFFVMGPFCTPPLALASDMTDLYRNTALLFLVLSTKKWYSSFLKKVSVFQKIYFIDKVCKTFKTSSDCHIKTC